MEARAIRAFAPDEAARNGADRTRRLRPGAAIVPEITAPRVSCVTCRGRDVIAVRTEAVAPRAARHGVGGLVPC